MPWTAPIGLPTPNWPTIGNPIDATPPVAPDSTPPPGWTGQVPNQYFVQPDDPAATDTDNPYGYPALPRVTAPDPLPAGAVVYCATWNFNIPNYYYVKDGGGNSEEGYPASPRFRLPKPIPANSKVFMDGTCSWGQVAPHDITAEGSATEPVWITNYDPDTPASLTGPWSIGEGSTFAIITGLRWNLFGYLYQSAFNVSGGPTYPTSYICLTNCYMRGKGSYDGIDGGTEENGGGFGTANNGTDWTTTAEHVVVHNFYFDRLGNWLYEEGGDPTGAGIVFGLLTRDCMAVDCEVAYSSGGGIGVGVGIPTTPDDEATLRCHVGRCHVHHVAQASCWSKRSKDCILSQNIIHTARRDDVNFSDAPGMGGQYGPINLAIIYNTVYDCQGGIHIMGGATEGAGVTNGRIMIVGNEVYNIHDTQGTAGPWNIGYDQGAGVAILLRGGSEVHVVNNTIYDYDAGINAKSDRLDYVEGNIFAARNTGVSGVDIRNETDGGGSNLWRYNIIQEQAGAIVVQNGGSTYTTVAALNAVGANKAGNITATPAALFTDADAADFTLLSDSPAIGIVATEPDVYEIFENYFGRSIRVDFAGNARPGSGLAAGAREYQGAPPPEPPASRTRTLRRSAGIML